VLVARLRICATAKFLASRYDPPAFALKLAHKDVSLANALGRELGIPMRICNLAHAEMTEAMARGWAGRDSRVVMLLQHERAGVEIAVNPELLREALAARTASRWGSGLVSIAPDSEA
jgi:3-hydroxyisobutyrate dehydrogenase